MLLLPSYLQYAVLLTQTELRTVTYRNLQQLLMHTSLLNKYDWYWNYNDWHI